MLPDNIRTDALLHDGDLLDDVLKVSVHRDLLDGEHLLALLVQSLEHGAVASLAELADDVEHLVRLLRQRVLVQHLQPEGLRVLGHDDGRHQSLCNSAQSLHFFVINIHFQYNSV